MDKSHSTQTKSLSANLASEQHLGVGVLREDRGSDGSDRSGTQIHGHLPHTDSGDVKGSTHREALWF